jgi:hypothetical protein
MEGPARIEGLTEVEAKQFVDTFALLSDRIGDTVELVKSSGTNGGGDGPTASEMVRHRIAAELANLAEGNLRICHDAGTALASDKSSQGHLYEAYDNWEKMDTAMILDDRQPQPLDVQLVAELRRVAQAYNELAEKVEKHVRIREFLPTAAQRSVTQRTRKAARKPR